MDPASKGHGSLIATEIEQLLSLGGLGVLITIIDGPNVGEKLLVDAKGRVTSEFSNGDLAEAAKGFAATFLASRESTKSFRVAEFAPQLAELAASRLLFERIQTEPRIVICGAGHVGAALAKLSALLGYRVTLIDDRGEFLSSDRFPEEGIELIKAERWADAVIAAIGNGAGVSVAIVTRGHNEDEQCLRAVMNTHPEYVGLIGSKRRTNIVLQRLRDAGVEEEKVRSVRAPVGLDIGAVTPEEVALAILAEVVAERRGGGGGSLSSWRRV
jgi:xanthine dehydrogenase accessory factor